MRVSKAHQHNRLLTCGNASQEPFCFPIVRHERDSRRAYGAAKMSIGFAAGAKERAEAEDRASAAHRAVHAALHAAVPA